MILVPFTVQLMGKVQKVAMRSIIETMCGRGEFIKQENIIKHLMKQQQKDTLAEIPNSVQLYTPVNFFLLKEG